jgi:hypothetical protein
MNCILEQSNQIYGCIPDSKQFFHIEFESHLIDLGYRFCNVSVQEEIEEFIRGECKIICVPACNTFHIETKVTYKKYAKKTNETIVETFPLRLQRIQYKETLNMDFNQLIYNCGGFLGLWLGLSPLSIDDLVNVSHSSFVSLKFKIFQVKDIIVIMLFKFNEIIILAISNLRDIIIFVIFKLTQLFIRLYIYRRFNNKITVEL